MISRGRCSTVVIYSLFHLRVAFFLGSFFFSVSTEIRHVFFPEHYALTLDSRQRLREKNKTLLIALGFLGANRAFTFSCAGKWLSARYHHVRSNSAPLRKRERSYFISTRRHQPASAAGIYLRLPLLVEKRNPATGQAVK